MAQEENKQQNNKLKSNHVITLSTNGSDTSAKNTDPGLGVQLSDRVPSVYIRPWVPSPAPQNETTQTQMKQKAQRPNFVMSVRGNPL
jgi:hypothetical protein